MAKIVDITDKLSFDGNPCLMVRGEKLEVNADAPTMLKIIGLMNTENTGAEIENLNKAYELVFPEESRNAIDAMKLSFKNWSTLIEAAMNLIMGDDEPGEQ